MRAATNEQRGLNSRIALCENVDEQLVLNATDFVLFLRLELVSESAPYCTTSRLIALRCT